MNAQSFNKKNTSRGYESRDPRNYGPGGMPGGRHSSRGGRYQNNQDKKESSEWNTVQKTPRYDPSRMRNFGNNSSSGSGHDNRNVRLGPQRKTWNNSNKSGSITKNASTDSNSSRGKDNSSRRGEQMTQNKFSALSMLSQDNQSSHQMASKSLSNSSNQSSQGSNLNRFSALTNSNVSPQPGSRDSSRNPSRERQPPKKSSSQQALKREDDKKFAKPAPPKPVKQEPAKPQLTPEERKSKHVGVIKEYLHLRDNREMEECCEELDMKTYGAEFVANAVNFAIERKAADCDVVGDIFEHLLNRKLISTEQAEKGIMASA